MSAAKNLDVDRLTGLVAVVDARLNGLPKFDFAHRTDYEAAVADMERRLRDDQGAVITATSEGIRVSLGGIRAHSTTGLVSALRNWLGQARVKLNAGGSA